MGTILKFKTAERAAFVAVALSAQGFGVLWNPAKYPTLVTTSESHSDIAPIIEESRGSEIKGWQRLAPIDVGKSQEARCTATT